MSPLWLLFIYALICIVASLAGGWVPLVVKLTHRRMQIAISFVSGIILGIGLLHLLPHSVSILGSIDRTVGWMMGGFLFMFFLERFFHFHHHDAPEAELLVEGARCELGHNHPAHEHQHSGHGHSHAAPTPSGGLLDSSFRWGGVAIGLTLHALIDGLALAAAVKSEQGHGVWLAGVGACLAVALHKPFDSLTIGTLMAAAGRTPRSRKILNIGYALVTPLGMLGFYALSFADGASQDGLGQTLGFAAGAFLCIATSDLLPELQFHRHDRAALSVALIAGIALAWGTVFLESAGHSHSPALHGHESSHEHEAGHSHEGHDHGTHAH